MSGGVPEGSSTEPPSAGRPAGASLSAWAVFGVCLILGVITDLWSKSLAFSRIAPDPVVVTRSDVLSSRNLQELIPPHAPVVVAPSVLELKLVLNPGAVFGIGAGKRVLFIVVTSVAVIAGVWVFLKWTTARDRLAHACLGLVLAGGLGNLYDRLVFGCVRDFLHPLPGVRVAGYEIWPYVSNVADAFLIVGVAGLMWFLWRAPEPAATPEPDSKTAPEA